MRSRQKQIPRDETRLFLDIDEGGAEDVQATPEKATKYYPKTTKYYLKADFFLGILLNSFCFIFCGEKYLGLPKSYERQFPCRPTTLFERSEAKKRLLKCFTKAAEKLAVVDYGLADGALLGYIRDGDFTKMWWDYDIDIMLTNKGLTTFNNTQVAIDEFLTPFGCGYDKNRLYDRKTAFPVDLDGTRFEKWASELHLPKEFYEPCAPIPGIEFKCVKNPELYLTKRYGDWSRYPAKTYLPPIFLVLFICFTVYKLLKKDYVSWVLTNLVSLAAVAFAGTFICLFYNDGWCFYS